MTLLALPEEPCDRARLTALDVSSSQFACGSEVDPDKLALSRGERGGQCERTCAHLGARVWQRSLMGKALNSVASLGNELGQAWLFAESWMSHGQRGRGGEWVSELNLRSVA